VKFKNSGFSR